jgi:hypothetical protein
MKIALQLKTLENVDVHGLVENLVPTLALVLRRVHRNVGAAQKRVYLRIAVGDGDPDTRVNDDVLTLDDEAGLQAVDDALGDTEHFTLTA